jgi:DNA-binding transcriptional LysR family regulator
MAEPPGTKSGSRLRLLYCEKTRRPFSSLSFFLLVVLASSGMRESKFQIGREIHVFCRDVNRYVQTSFAAENHPAVKNETLDLQDLANDEWILFPKRLHPIVYDAIMSASRRDGIRPKCTHDAVTAEQAIHLVSEQVGVGIVTKPNAFDSRPKNVVLKPFSDKSLRFETCVIMRKGDDSRLTNQFVRTLLRKFKLPPQAGGQMELSLSA